MYTTLRNLSVAGLIFLIALTGCDIADSDEPSQGLEGIYVLNQGNFSDGVASITIFDPESDSVEQNAFKNRNGRPLGSVGQSFEQIDNLLYTIINNSHKVEVLQAENLQHVGTIDFVSQSDTLSPRYMIEAREGIGYVTNWDGFGSPGYVSVVDLESYEVIKNIQVGLGPEQLAKIGDNVYVANSGFGNGNTLSVIDTQQDKVTGHIKVDDNPINLAVDQSDRLWVLCQGAYHPDDTPGKLYVLDKDGTKLDSLTISLEAGSAKHPGGFALNEKDQTIYLLKGGVHTINMRTLEMDQINFIKGPFFALEFSSQGEKPRVYTTDAKGFQQAGEAFIYDLDGSAIDSFKTAVGPGDFHFSTN